MVTMGTALIKVLHYDGRQVEMTAVGTRTVNLAKTIALGPVVVLGIDYRRFTR